VKRCPSTTDPHGYESDGCRTGRKRRSGRE
jgi:hypothetical protein